MGDSQCFATNGQFSDYSFDNRYVIIKHSLFASKAIALCPSPKLLQVSNHLGLYDVLVCLRKKKPGE